VVRRATEAFNHLVEVIELGDRRGRGSYRGSRAWKRRESHGRVRRGLRVPPRKVVRVQVLGSRAQALEAAGVAPK
jgi:hypothetical protein